MTYKTQLKNGIYSCTCMAWKMQRRPIRYRTCKHLKAWLGEKHEMERCAQMPPPVPQKSVRPSITFKPMKYQWIDPGSSYQWIDPGINSNDQSKPFMYKGWYASRKYNGAWAVWDSPYLWTKGRRPIQVPKDHPLHQISAHLVGEMYHENPNLVREMLHNQTWNPECQFLVFDCLPKAATQSADSLPEAAIPFTERWKMLKTFKKKKIDIIPQIKIKSADHWETLKQEAISRGWEGWIVRHPESLYQQGKRVKDVLKWKPLTFSTAEIQPHETTAKKTGYTVTVLDPVHFPGRPFRLFVPGNGLSKIHPSTSVRYRFSGVTETGKPDIPVFLNIV